MTLTTHAVLGAAIASAIPSHPAVGFCLAFCSHFVLDAIPHWDYKIRSNSIDPHIASKKISLNRAFLGDMLRIGSDALIGIALSLFLFTHVFSAGSSFFHSFSFPLTWVVLLGAVGGILPDALQFAWIHFQHQPLTSLQRFHQWIHTNIRFKKSPYFGMATQVFLLAAFILIVKSRL